MRLRLQRVYMTLTPFGLWVVQVQPRMIQVQLEERPEDQRKISNDQF